MFLRPYQCKSPVLFLVFNRPDVTAYVFEAIQRVRPAKLYIAADGPRDNKVGEVVLCQKVREIATAVDWDCEVKTLFRDQNLGCEKAVSKAITWFFNDVEDGIILEDDCLPHVSFFEYCDLMLKTCREDASVWSISGTKFRCYPYSRNLLGYESEVFFCWGWATWRNRWQYYTGDLDELLPIRNFTSSKASSYWKRAIRRMENQQVSSWAYKFALLSIKYSRKNIVPPCNLVKNVGFDDLSTHTEKPPRHCLQFILPFIQENRKGFAKAAFFDGIYYGQYNQFPLFRYLYYIAMYVIGISDKIAMFVLRKPF